MMLTDPQCIVDFASEVHDYNEEVQALRQEIVTERQFRHYMYISAEVVMAIESEILNGVFGKKMCKERRLTMQSILKPKKPDLKALVASNWPFYLAKVTKGYGSATSFCSFLTQLKKERHFASHKEHQPRIGIGELEKIILRYGEESERRRIATLDDIDPIVLPDGEKEAEKRQIRRQWKNREKNTNGLMLVVRDIVGEFPFGKPRVLEAGEEEGDDIDDEEEEEEDEEKAEAEEDTDH